MQILDFEQGSVEWHQARLGIPTASRFSDIITPAKGGLSTSYKKYIAELIAERIEGLDPDAYTSSWMQRGNDLEIEAFTNYEFITDMTPETTGIILNDEGTIGASPDGLIELEGGLEVKCPKLSTAVSYMMDDDLPLIYKPQVQGNLWLSEREWWDFVVYHPSLKLFIKRIHRDEEYIKKMAEHMDRFTTELHDTYERLIK